MARAAGLIAIAVLPAVAGIAGADYTRPAAFDAGFDRSLWVAAAVVAVGGPIAAFTISNQALAEAPDDEAAEETAPAATPALVPLPDRHDAHGARSVSHCAIGAPPLQVRDDGVPTGWGTGDPARR